MDKPRIIHINRASKKSIKEYIIPRFFNNKEEIHLISLGQGGGITEKIDGQFFAVKVHSNGKIFIKTARGEYTDAPNENGHKALLEHLRTEMFPNLLKMKKMYGGFEFEGELIYAPQNYYDKDNTVTVVATKYHRVRMGNQGTVVIRSFKTSTIALDMSEFVEEDAINALKLFFNIHSYNGFKCYTNEEMIPNEQVDTSVTIPPNWNEIEVPQILNMLAENNKSMLNGSIEVKGCEVEGYVFCVNGKPHKIVNRKWYELKDKYLEKYNTAANNYEFMKSEGAKLGDIEVWIEEDCKSFLTDEEVPLGIRYNKKERLLTMLEKLCWDNGISMEDYLKLVNDFLLLLN